MDERTVADLKRLKALETSDPVASSVLMQLLLWRVCELLTRGSIGDSVELAMELTNVRDVRRKNRTERATQRLIDADPES